MAGAGVLHRIASAYGERRYTILFCLLLLTFVVNPLMAVIRPRGHALDMFLWLNLVAAAVGIRTRRGWVLAVLGLAAILGLETSTHRPIGALSYALWALLALIAAATAIRFTLRAREVGAEQMYAALSAYLLTGLFFGAIHWSVEDIWPGSYAASTGRR